MKRLITKQDRLNSRKAQFDRLIEKGYNHETYKDLDIFVQHDPKSSYLKVFKGTGANPICYEQYRNQDRLTARIEGLKKSADWREKDRAGNTRRTTGAAETAKAIRQELKQAFPGIKFSVRSETFSMGDSVRVSWEDGPLSKQVTEIIGKYQYGHFDGMTDMYENSNSRKDIPQTKFVQTRREKSEQVKAVFNQFVEDNPFKQDHRYDIERQFYQIWQETPLPAGAEVTGYRMMTDEERQDKYSIFTLEYSAPEPVIPKQKTNAAQPAPADVNVQVIEYSDRAIAVIGETYPIKDQLKQIGARFNKFLRIDGQTTAGWILPAAKRQDLNFLNA